MINKQFIIGRLGQAPKVHVFENGDKVVRLSIATDLKYRDKQGEQRKLTDWHNVEVNGKSANFAEKYLQSGTLVYVEGRATSRKYTKDDVQQTTHFINCRELKILANGKRDSNNMQTSANQSDVPWEENAKP